MRSLLLQALGSPKARAGRNAVLARATAATKDSLYRFRPRRGRGSSLRVLCVHQRLHHNHAETATARGAARKAQRSVAGARLGLRRAGRKRSHRQGQSGPRALSCPRCSLHTEFRTCGWAVMRDWLGPEARTTFMAVRMHWGGCWDL